MKFWKSAPFPYHGGKSRQAKEVWARFGDPTVYVEPFAGSLAVLLARETPCQREIVCDLHSFIPNFWRALREDPEAVAYWADYPTFHHDLTARHRWLIAWARENGELLSMDADWYDAQAAGWWAWGISSWIGGGWCVDKGDVVAGVPEVYDKRPLVLGGSGAGVQAQRQSVPQIHDKRPLVAPSGSGVGVQAQRLSVPKVKDQRPHVDHRGGGNGLQAQRSSLPKVHDKRPSAEDHAGGTGVQAQRSIPQVTDQRPFVDPRGGGNGLQAQRSSLPKVTDQRPHVPDRLGGQGVQTQRRQLSEQDDIGSGERFAEWFHALAQRLSRVVVLNRDWSSAVTPTLLMHTKTSSQPPVGIFLDPPYRREKRTSAELYNSDAQGTSEDTAVAAYEWAVEHGANPMYRIAYCCHEGDFPVPDGWTVSGGTSISAVRKVNRKGRRDITMYSPGCLPLEPQSEMRLAAE